MAADRVEIDTSGLTAMLARMRARVPVIGRDACRDTAALAADKTRATVPRRSGALAASVSVGTEADGATVSMETPYAGWIEYGGTRGRAYVAEGRYLGSATAGADNQIAMQAERDIQREARTW